MENKKEDKELQSPPKDIKTLFKNRVYKAILLHKGKSQSTLQNKDGVKYTTSLRQRRSSSNNNILNVFQTVASNVSDFSIKEP